MYVSHPIHKRKRDLLSTIKSRKVPTDNVCTSLLIAMPTMRMIKHYYIGQYLERKKILVTTVTCMYRVYVDTLRTISVKEMATPMGQIY